MAGGPDSKTTPTMYLPLAFISASSWIAIHTLVERPLESCLGIATVAAGLPIEYARRRVSQTVQIRLR
jgi:hypothetical protein